MKFVKSIQIQLEDIDFVSFLRSAIASLKRDLFSEQSGVVIYCNLGQTICNKVEKASKVGQDKKCLTSPFACFLTAIAIVYFLEGKMGNALSLYPDLRFFQYFLIC